MAKLGDRVRIRFGNLGAMDHHPIHLHGYDFKMTETDGGAVPRVGPVPAEHRPGAGRHHAGDRVRRRRARRLGDALPHDPSRHEPDGPRRAEHDRRQDRASSTRRCGSLLPGYMTMGDDRHGRHGRHGHGRAEEQHPDGRRHGPVRLRSTWAACSPILKVRDGHRRPTTTPAGTSTRPARVAEAATADDLRRDGIDVGAKPPARHHVVRLPHAPRVVSANPDGRCPKCGMKLRPEEELNV